MGGHGENGANAALRALLDEAEMSNTALASAVMAAGAREGIHLGTSSTTVRRMLDGSQPHWPTPRLVAAVLSHRLQREISVRECGFADCAPAGEDPYDGLRWSGTLEGAVRTVVELSGRDMRRRKLLLGSAFSVGAFAEPALSALLVPPAQSTARAGGRRVGMAEVEILTEQIAHLSKLGGQYGSGRVREQMVALLHREANQLLNGTYSEKTGRALLSAVARATYTAGWMSGDVGRYSLAQRYHIQALDLAMRAGDQAFGANILQEAGRLTVRLGENAPPGQDTTRHGRQAVALARAGLRITQDSATPALAAKLHAVQARGFALLGDARETRHAVLAAQRAYESVSPDDAAALYTVNGFGVDLGKCLSGIGDTEQALTFSTMALDGCNPWAVRGRCVTQTDLALTHLHSRDLEQAAAFGRDALRTAANLSSTITLERLRTLQRQVALLRSASSQLLDLDERLTGFLTRTTHGRHDDTPHPGTPHDPW
ncbi:MAG: hypothetical protein ABR608_03210 [Pseudonocardiaceae bacterium]